MIDGGSYADGAGLSVGENDVGLYPSEEGL
jgi:hypothetical protein